MINGSFWKGKRVFITGHTGFKGSWLCLWLISLGAEVIGYAEKPPTLPNLFEIAGISHDMHSTIGDIREIECLKKSLCDSRPDIVIHMAAQPLVRESYKDPVTTYSTNIMGTINVLEAIRKCESVKAVVNITTDKCYENREWVWGYREDEALGGYDPYSSSKACSEIVTAAYRNSFFYASEHPAVASARAGNVIGGGDWAADRLIPDCLKSLIERQIITIRNPNAIRPWQHVLEPLSGYLLLAERLYENGHEFASSWNFGPEDKDAKPVEWIVGELCDLWEENAGFQVDKNPQPHEATYLKLDCSKARARLAWTPKWNLEKALEQIVIWTQAYQQHQDMRLVCLKQIDEYMHSN